MTQPPSRDARQGRGLLVAATVLVALVAVIVAIEPPEPSPDSPPDREWTELTPRIPLDELREITVALPDGGQLVCEKRAGEWTATQPPGMPLETRHVETLAGALARLELGPALDGPGTAYGLERPRATVTLVGVAEQRLTLQIGDDAPVGASTYVLTPDGQTRPSRSALGSLVPDSPAQWRSGEVTGLSRAQIKEVIVRERLLDAVDGQPTTTVALSKDDLGWWVTNSEGVKRRAEQRQATALIDALLFVRADDYAPPPLSTPAPILITLKSDGETEDLKLWPGEAPEDLWRVEGPHQGGPVMVRPDDLGLLLDRAHHHWLSAEIMPVHGITLERITVSLAGTQLTADRTSDGWSDPRAQGFLGALDVAEARRDPPAPTPEQPPWGSIVLSEGGTREETVTFHQLLEDGSRVAVDGAGGPPFRVDAAGLRTLAEAVAGVASAAAP